MADRASQIGVFVLSKYLLGQELSAAVAMEMIYQTYGREGVYRVAVTWCDYILERTPEYQPGEPVHLVWEEVATGTIRHAEEAPPMVRWAGQVLAARAADDQANAWAIFSAVPEEHLAEHMATLLQTLAIQLRAFKEEGTA
jgi:hypothetical protein